MSILADHRPHVPWRKVRAVVTPKGGAEHHVDLHVADEGTSIAEWLASGDAAAATPVDLPQSLPYLEAEHVTVHAEPTADETVQARIEHMTRYVHQRADRLAAEFDERMGPLVLRARRLDSTMGVILSRFEQAWEATAEVLARVLVTRRRKAAVTPLVLGLGQLVAAGDVSKETAAAVVSLRSKYLHAVDAPSERLPRLTPELLAQLDRTLGMRKPTAPVLNAPEVTVHAPGCRYDGCCGRVEQRDEEGGYEVALPGAPRALHFERSELEFAASPQSGGAR